MKKLILSFLISTLMSCALPPPSEDITQPPLNDITLAEVQQNYEPFIGSKVRWGGRILKVVEVGDQEQQRLHLEVQEYPLDAEGIPLDSASPGGRFIARVAGPYKKASYYRGRLITLAGHFTTVETYPLATGDTQILPVITSSENRAWRQEYRDEHDDYWPRFFFRFGIGSHGHSSGVGVIFH
ncbi:MAG: Slp family lipoprotein [Cellvibrionaceae bacterium]